MQPTLTEPAGVSLLIGDTLGSRNWKISLIGDVSVSEEVSLTPDAPGAQCCHCFGGRLPRRTATSGALLKE